MSGIAGYLGNKPEGVDLQSLFESLSFTGIERMDVEKREGFTGLSVSHQAGSCGQPGSFTAEDGLCMLLDGYITQIDGKDIDPTRPREALRVCAALYREHGRDFALKLNGSFSIAIHDGRDGILSLVTDRLSSRPLSYFRKDGSVAFSTRAESFRAFGMDFNWGIRPESLVEFLSFSTLINSPILLEQKKVPPATFLKFSSGTVEEHAYWECRFSYGEGRGDFEESAERLADSIKKACARSINGSEPVGLLLSGGMDSRVVLSCLPEETFCYTSCDCMNYETRLARKVARANNSPHRLLKRGPFHYLEIVPEASRLTEGALEYHHAHMVNLHSHMVEVSKGVMLHGMAFDSMLKGHYLPEVSWEVAGRHLSPSLLKDCPTMDDAIDALARIEFFRLDAPEMLSLRLRRDFRDYPQRALRALAEDNAGSVVRPMDVLELFIFKDLSRCPTYPFVEGVRQYLPERWIITDNSILDVALETPPEMRFNSRLVRRALSILDPRMSRISNASTFLPMGMGNVFNLTHRFPLRLYNRLYVPLASRTFRRGTPRWMLTPGAWQSIGYFWRYGPIAGRLEELLSDPSAMRDEVIDPAAVMAAIDRHRSGETGSVTMLARLITFLEWRSRCPE